MRDEQLWELGDLLREARERMRPRMSQEELGRRAGISRPMVSMLERGQIIHPRIGMLAGIAKILDIPPAAIFSILGVSSEDAAPGELHWLASQLDQEHLVLLVELGHGILRVQHRQPPPESPPLGPPGRGKR